MGFVEDDPKSCVNQLKRLSRYDDLLSAYFPDDFKDWHENSREEWPDIVVNQLKNRDKETETQWALINDLLDEIKTLKETQLKPGEVRAVWMCQGCECHEFDGGFCTNCGYDEEFKELVEVKA